MGTNAKNWNDDDRNRPTHVDDLSQRADVRNTVLGRIDQYDLLKELGTGGFGSVYLARDTTSRTLVAVKGLPAQVKDSEEEMERIRKNFALVSPLHHQNIAAALVLHMVEKARYADVEAERKLNVQPGQVLMVMQYAPGVTLSKWRRQFPEGKVPFEKAVEVARQIAAALDFAHGNKIIHRDIKPSNVMVDTMEDGSVSVRVLDFGIAAEIRSSVNRTSENGVTGKSGTRQYMSPEQWGGKIQGPATDQYALAALVYELVTGDVPFASVFDCGDPIVMMTVVTSNSPDIPSDLPKTARQALARALAKTADERFACCSDFVAVLGGGKATGKAASVVQKASAPSNIHRRNLIASVLTVAVLAGGGFAAYTWHEGEQQKKRDAEAARQAQIAAEIAAQRAKELEALRTLATEVMGKAATAYEDAAKRKFDTYPELASTLRAFNASYKSGREAFEKKDYAAATNFFERTGEAMRQMAAEQRRLDAVRAEEARVADVRRKVASGGYDSDKDKDGKEIAVWVPKREVNGRMTSDREGVWRTKVDCPDCKGTGSCSHETNCEQCSGSGQVNGATQCLTCSGRGKVSRRHVCALCSGAGVRRTDCTAGCSEITRNNQVLFSHGFVCSNCSGSGTVANGAGIVGDIAGAAIGAAIFGSSYRPRPSAPPRVTCSQCNGLGGYQCGTCSGTGTVQSRCYACSGNGSVMKDEPCRDCAGKGQRPVRVQCSKCRNGKVTTSSSCSKCDGAGKMWMEESGSDAGKQYFLIETRWTPTGSWRAEYEQSITSPGGLAVSARIVEELACRKDGEFSRARTVNGKTASTQGKWYMTGDLLVLAVLKADGSRTDTSYRLLQCTDDSFELRFADVKDFERGLAVQGRTAVATYRDDGTLATELTVGGQVTSILQAAKIFRKADK